MKKNIFPFLLCFMITLLCCQPSTTKSNKFSLSEFSANGVKPIFQLNFNFEKIIKTEIKSENEVYFLAGNYNIIGEGHYIIENSNNRTLCHASVYMWNGSTIKQIGQEFKGIVKAMCVLDSNNIYVHIECGETDRVNNTNKLFNWDGVKWNCLDFINNKYIILDMVKFDENNITLNLFDRITNKRTLCLYNKSIFQYININQNWGIRYLTSNNKGSLFFTTDNGNDNEIKLYNKDNNLKTVYKTNKGVYLSLILALSEDTLFFITFDENHQDKLFKINKEKIIEMEDNNTLTELNIYPDFITSKYILGQRHTDNFPGRDYSKYFTTFTYYYDYKKWIKINNNNEYSILSFDSFNDNIYSVIREESTNNSYFCILNIKELEGSK